MPKRVAFVVLMLAIPVVVAAGLYYSYRVLRASAVKDLVIVEPRYWLANNSTLHKIVFWLTNRGPRPFHDSAKKALEQTLEVLAQSKGAEYRDNWLQVLTFVPIPAVSDNLLPNVRGRFVNTNDLGYRGTLNYRAQIAEARKLKGDGFRIAILTGGSAAFGTFSDDERTDIVGHLNQMSRDQGGKIRYYNFAMPSYTSAQELNALVTYAAALEPDLLIAFHGFDDALRLTEPGTYNVGIGVPYIYLSFRKSQTVFFRSEYLDRVYDVDKVTAEQEAEFLEHYRRNIRLMAKVMAGRGGTMIVATQPVRFFGSSCQGGQRSTKFVENFRRFYPKMIESARDTSSAQKTGYLDLTAVFSGSGDRCREVFADAVHLTSYGQRVVADRLHAAVTKTLAPPK